jgi:hypothetical protein
MKPHYSRAESIAKRVKEKYNLPVGFNIFDFANSNFSVSVESFPEGIDGLCVKIQGETQLYINKDKAETRKRFTLGHELGHHYIPWHIGERACEIDGGISVLNDDDFVYKHQEGEANAFSSELLCPLDFMESIFNNDDKLVNSFHELSKTGLSTIAKLLAIKRFWETRPYPKAAKAICLFKNGVCEHYWCDGSYITHNFLKGMDRNDIVCSLDSVACLTVSPSLCLVEYSATPGEFIRAPSEKRKYGKELLQILIKHGVEDCDRVVKQISGKIGCRISGQAKNHSPESVLNSIVLKLRIDHQSLLQITEVKNLISDWVLGR